MPDCSDDEDVAPLDVEALVDVDAPLADVAPLFAPLELFVIF